MHSFLQHSIWRLLLWTGILWPSISLAQLITIDPEQERLSIAEYIEYYEDGSEALTIDDVLTPNFSVNFIPHDRNLFHFGITSSAFWIRFDLDWSRSNPGAVKVLELGPPLNW